MRDPSGPAGIVGWCMCSAQAKAERIAGDDGGLGGAGGWPISANSSSSRPAMGGRGWGITVVSAATECARIPCRLPPRSIGQVLAASPSTAAGGAIALRGVSRRYGQRPAVADLNLAIGAGDTITLPLYLAGAFLREISPQIYVLSTLVFVVSGGLLLLACLPARTS